MMAPPNHTSPLPPPTLRGGEPSTREISHSVVSGTITGTRIYGLGFRSRTLDEYHAQ